MSDSAVTLEERYDVVVVGSGGGLVGAYIAASRGLRTLVIEKTEFVGGTTAYSGAGLWLPGNTVESRGGGASSSEAARIYLDSIVGDDAPVYLREAYLRAGPQLIDELEQNPRFEFQWFGVPDYFADAPGSFATGHTIFPTEIEESELGALASLVREPVWTERWGVDPGSVLGGGRALIARTLLALIETGNGTVRTGTALQSLLVEDGAVVGVEAMSAGTQVTIRADRGVLLAAGGFERNPELRSKYQPQIITDEWTMGCQGNTGDALQAGLAVGAGSDLLNESWFVPGLVVPNNRPVFWTSTWSGIYVNGAGERFMNENLPYDQAGHTMAKLHSTTGVSHIPTHWVFDQRQIDDDVWQLPVDPPVPGWFDADKWLEAGVLKRADTLAELAELIGVPAGALEKSVDEFNGFARDGADKQFHRGEAPWDRYIVTGAGAFAGLRPHDGPNPCLAPLDRPPFYAATIVVSDLGTKGGLTTDDHARVLRPDNSVIKGLYAAGNTMAPMTGRVYPGAGGPIGSSITFSYLAALDMAAESR